MAINKKEGIEFLSSYVLKTLQFINIEELLKSNEEVQEGMTLRVSPKGNYQRNVMLPSIYNCKDKEKIKNFLVENQQKYNVFMHKTIRADKIGSVSKIHTINQDMLILEVFKSFKDREKENIDNRMIIPILGGRYMISNMELMKKDEQDFNQFIDVFKNIRKLPFSSYNIEYFVKDGKIIFTEFTSEAKEFEEYLEIEY